MNNDSKFGVLRLDLEQIHVFIIMLVDERSACFIVQINYGFSLVVDEIQMHAGRIVDLVFSDWLTVLSRIK